MQLLQILLAISPLIAFITAAPLAYHDSHQELIKIADPKQHLTKRGMEIFSPVFDAYRPDRSLFNPEKTAPPPPILPRPELAHGSGTIPKTPHIPPWQSKPPPSTKPKLIPPVLEPVCTHAGPYCPPRLTPIVGGIKDSLAKLSPKTGTKDPVMSKVVPKPVAVGSGAMSVGELARNIVAQIPVECPNCGYGGGKISNWTKFVEWLKKVWQKMRGGSV